MEPLHGTRLGTIDRVRIVDAEARALKVLEDDGLRRLLEHPREKRDLEASRQIFVNRNLRMANVGMIGFDMDYTLAIYHQRRIEQLSFEMTVDKLVTAFGYPQTLRTIPYDHQFVIRGLFVDKRNGNLLKIDRFGGVGRAYHGRTRLADDALQKLYRNERIRLKNPEYAWIDTLFALPEASLFADAIELLERREARPLEYGKLYDDIREAIDTVHRDGSLKVRIRAEISRYIFKDPELGPALHRLRSGGKKLFVLTNSLWDYTDAVMQYLLDGVLPEYPSWKNYFDVVITGAAKPAFFTEQRPFLEIDGATALNTQLGEAGSLDRGKVYQGGNLLAFEKFTGFGGESLLYVGDHIYGDILKSKKSSMWRTCMVVQEIEDEITYTDSRRVEIERLSAMELLRARIDDEVSVHKGTLSAIDRKLDRGVEGQALKAQLEDEKKRVKGELDVLRKALRECNEVADILEADVERGFNPYWGLLFKEGNENSRFGEQVEQYACLYTSRVSNFFFYSPTQFFRSPRDQMAHENAFSLSARLSPLGGEGPPRGANRAE